MTVNDNWIPFENTYEQIVIGQMTENGRRFVKGLRYNLPSSRPLATLVASDTKPNPVAMYVLPLGAPDDYANAMESLIAESGMEHWLWDPSVNAMPALPPLEANTEPTETAVQ